MYPQDMDKKRAIETRVAVPDYVLSTVNKGIIFDVRKKKVNATPG